MVYTQNKKHMLMHFECLYVVLDLVPFCVHLITFSIHNSMSLFECNNQLLNLLPRVAG